MRIPRLCVWRKSAVVFIPVWRVAITEPVEAMK